MGLLIPGMCSGGAGRDQKMRVVLGYIENRRPAWADPISKEARQMQ